MVISFQLEIFFSNVKRFHIGLRQEISVRNHMCQCSACFMEDRCMFIGFVVAYCGFIWFNWLQSTLKFNVLDLCFPRPTSGKWQTIFLYFHYYCRYLKQNLSAHMYITVILADQVSKQILQGNLLRFTLTHHWQFWVVMINGGESAYFQSDLLDLDAFLTILHFVRDSLRCYTWFHPSPDRLGLAVDTWSCCTFQVANEPVRI